MMSSNGDSPSKRQRGGGVRLAAEMVNQEGKLEAAEAKDEQVKRQEWPLSGRKRA